MSNIKVEYDIEYKVGDVRLIKSNILIKDVTDMEEVEFWEDRLKLLKQPFTIAYRTIHEKICYTIFANIRGKESIFK